MHFKKLNYLKFFFFIPFPDLVPKQRAWEEVFCLLGILIPSTKERKDKHSPVHLTF